MSIPYTCRDTTNNYTFLPVQWCLDKTYLGHTFFTTITILIISHHSSTQPSLAMVNKGALSHTSEGTSISGDTNVLTDMHAAMNGPCHQNQTLENNILNIRQRQQESSPPKEMEALDPQSLSDVIWEAQVLEGIKSPSFARSDGRTDPYEHVASIYSEMVIVGAPDSLNCK